ncbi:MAG: YbhB/YbcL family Raf kinase inhibitor-like protein [Candidatus Brocadiia bacterium]
MAVRVLAAGCAVAALALAGCGEKEGPGGGRGGGGLTLASPAFEDGGALPREHVPGLGDVPPPLSWSGVPRGTEELALVCGRVEEEGEEPAVHLVAYKIPADARSLDDDSLVHLGTNTWGLMGYGGPSPAKGQVHRYAFTLYALDAPMPEGRGVAARAWPYGRTLEAREDRDRVALGLTLRELAAEMEGHVLAEARLVGRYALLELTSSAFGPGERIPVKYTADGDDVSPPLAWSGVPGSARELALVCDDPDAPAPEPWVHWVLYKIPADRSSLAEGDAGGAVEGTNSFAESGYRGPAPPPGGVHRYRFRIYPLDQPLDLPPGASKAQLLEAMAGHILGEGELVGTYGR